MRRLFTRALRSRNPRFFLDKSVTTKILIRFFWQYFVMYARGFKLLLSFRRPNGLLLERKVRFFLRDRIKWGKWVKLGEGVQLNALGKKGITLGSRTSIGAFSRLVVSTTLNEMGEYIKIGERVGIGEYSYLGGAGGLEIGSDCIVGQYFSCHPENHNYDRLNTLIRNQGTSRKGIKIGDNCWIGAKVTIVDGVTIGKGCVIAAGAVVTKSFPPNCVIAGVPAKRLKYRDEKVKNSIGNNVRGQSLQRV